MSTGLARGQSWCGPAAAGQEPPHEMGILVVPDLCGNNLPPKATSAPHAALLLSFCFIFSLNSVHQGGTS